MIAISILIFVGCFAMFLSVWSATSHRHIAITPFLVFVLFEVVCCWPAMIVGQIHGLADAGPAIMAGIAFLIFLTSYTVVLGKGRGPALDLVRFRDASVERHASDFAYLVSIVALSLLTICLGLYRYRGMPPVIAGLFQSSSHTEFVGLTATVRGEAKEHYFGGEYRGQGIITTISSVAFPYLIMVSILLYRTRLRLAWLLPAILLFMLGFVFIGGGGRRYDTVMFVFFFAIAATLLWKFSIRHVTVSIALVIAATLMVVPASSQLTGVTDSDNASRDISLSALERITLGNGMTNLEVINFIDNGLLDYGWGDIHLQKIVNSFPGVTHGIPFSNMVQHLRTPHSQMSYASMTYMGILYADFGPVGVCLGYMLIGVIAAVAQGYLFQMRKGILEFPAIIYSIILYSEMVLGSSVSMGASLVILIAFYGLFKLLVSMADYRGLRRHDFRSPIRSPGIGVKRSVRRQIG